jgi:hypothetical protein
MSVSSGYQLSSESGGIPGGADFTINTSFLPNMHLVQDLYQKLSKSDFAIQETNYGCEYDMHSTISGKVEEKEEEKLPIISNLPVSACYKPLKGSSSVEIFESDKDLYQQNDYQLGPYDYLPPTSPISTFSDGLSIPRVFDLSYVANNLDFLQRFSSDGLMMEDCAKQPQVLQTSPQSENTMITEPVSLKSSRSKRMKLLLKQQFVVRFEFTLRKDQFRKITQAYTHVPIEEDKCKPFTSEFFDLKFSRYRLIDEMKNDPNFTQMKCVNNTSKYKDISSNTTKEDDIYLCRLNVYELASILKFDEYDIKLTKEIELNVLEIFHNYCKFNLGYQTWIRDTDKLTRSNLINQLYLLTYYFYPELDKYQLEAIIRKGIYSLMQTRLRKERRLMSIAK